MDILRQKHEAGRRVEPTEFVEAGSSVAVRLGNGGYKVFTFAGDDVVPLEDCIDREDALARLR